MSDSPWTLIIFTLAGLGLLLFLPRFGLLALLRRRKTAIEREQAEDALKHLLEQTWDRRSATAGTLKASLNLNDRRTLHLVGRMSQLGWLNVAGDALVLTPEGERLAIQITRAHRLLERYLADEARMPLHQIHQEAHHREHRVSARQIDEIDAWLGYPTSDPHGDPIPSRSGAHPRRESQPLTAWPVGQVGRVVHIEDEPAIAYAQVQAEGLHPGQTLRVVEVTPERFILTDGENEFRLAPMIAAHVFLERVETLSAPPSGIRLHELQPQQRGEILALDEACQGFTRRRFLDLGLTPGAIIAPELLNAFGDPRAYRVRGTLIALRKEQTQYIWVKPHDPQPETYATEAR